MPAMLSLIALALAGSAAADSSNLFHGYKWRDCSSSGFPDSVGYITGTDTNYTAGWAVNPSQSPLLNSGSDLSVACEGLLQDGQAGEIYMIDQDPNCTTCYRMAVYDIDAGVMGGRVDGDEKNWVCSKSPTTKPRACYDAELTCHSVKESYKHGGCCGNPNKGFVAGDLYPEAEGCYDFGFDLVDLEASQSTGMAVPPQAAYQPVTLQALIDSGHVNYTWISQLETNEHAPGGAYVYQMQGGGLLYKNIVPKAVADGPMLAFGCGKPLGMVATFADAESLGTALMYRSGPVSIDAMPFKAYSKYAWVQLSGMDCGAFVYEVKARGAKALYYHTCG